MKTNPYDDIPARKLVSNILVEHTAFSSGAARLVQAMKAGGLSDSIGIPVLAESRCGKTRLLEAVESTFPATRTREGCQIPVIRIRVPSMPSIRSIIIKLLEEFGDPAALKGTAAEMEYRLKILIRECATRMIILDESQHFFDRTKGYRLIHTSTDWLKVFMDEAKIILVSAGLPYSKGILCENEQLAGRVLAPIYLPRFDWSNPILRAEFQGVLGGFESRMSEHFEVPQLSSEEMAFRFFLATGGLLGYASKILQQATWNVLDMGRNTINLADLDLAYKQAILDDNPSAASPFSRDFRPTSAGDSIEQALRIGTRGEFLNGGDLASQIMVNRGKRSRK